MKMKRERHACRQKPKAKQPAEEVSDKTARTPGATKTPRSRTVVVVQERDNLGLNVLKA